MRSKYFALEMVDDNDMQMCLVIFPRHNYDLDLMFFADGYIAHELNWQAWGFKVVYF